MHDTLKPFSTTGSQALLNLVHKTSSLIGFPTRLPKMQLHSLRGIERPSRASSLPPCGFVHIGKTGGNSLRSHAEKTFAADKTLKLLFLGHNARLPEIAPALPNLRYAMILRDPLERTISGFNSRLRNGRPGKSNLWTPEEAAAFSFFADAGEFAKAFCGHDERTLSAARFAMGAIKHLRRNYRHHFGPPDQVRRFIALNSFVYIASMDEIADDFAPLCRALGLPTPEDIGAEVPHEHAARKGSTIDPEALAALKRELAEEYEIYNLLMEARQRLVSRPPKSQAQNGSPA